MINKELHRGDIIVVETNGKRIFGVIVTNNNLNYNQDQVGMVNISTQTDGVCLAYVDIFTNQPAKAICNKVWNVWKSDIVEFIRECTTEEMHSIDKALRYTFGLDEPQKKYDITDAAAALQKASVEELRAYVARLKEENDHLKSENAGLKLKKVDLAKEIEAREAEIIDLRHQLEKANEDTDYYIEQAAKAEPNVAALIAERDTYRAMYEALIDRMFKR